MKVYLVRHAEIARAPGDPGLTPRGETQAAAVGAFLNPRSVTRVFTSPLRRARQTAAIIAGLLGAPLDIDERLRERINWGDVPGQTWEEFAAEWERGDLDPTYIPRAGLSTQQAAARLSDFMAETAARLADGSIAAVTHGGIISDFLAAYYPTADLARLHPAWETTGSEVITHCSITTVSWSAGGPLLEGIALVVPLELNRGLPQK